MGPFFIVEKMHEHLFGKRWTIFVKLRMGSVSSGVNVVAEVTELSRYFYLLSVLFFVNGATNIAAAHLCAKGHN